VPLLHFRYGAYLSKDEVAELVRPYPESLELISAWLVHHGIRPAYVSQAHGGAWLKVTDVLVSQANHLLGASYQLYRNTETNDMIIRTVGYALPAVLHPHIQAVAPTTYFASTQATGQTLRRRSFGAAPAPAASGKLVTSLSSRIDEEEVEPPFLRSLYKTVAYMPHVAGQNRLAVVGFNGQFPNQDDLTEFMIRFDTFAADATFAVVQVNGGGNNPNDPGEQANIDVQYAGAMAFPTPIIFYSVGGDLQWEPAAPGVPVRLPIAGDRYLEWFNHLIQEPNRPQTISISYTDNELALPPEYAVFVCSLFARLGLLGVSVLAASGSEGVGAGDCVNAQETVQFIPRFPSSCMCDVSEPLLSTRHA
jgi:tripeptidyl-peptidase-1